MIYTLQRRPLLQILQKSIKLHRNLSYSAQMTGTMEESTRSLANSLLRRERVGLSKSITLVESSRKDHKEQAAHLIDYVLEEKFKQHNAMRKKSLDKDDTPEGRRLFPTHQTLRIGIAGPPGAGKSTFIEAFGLRMIGRGHRVAVIPVDPSSHISGGSILGDKTRMDELSKSRDAYVRASPTRGVLGGIAEHTSDVISLCECAGFDFVIVESVGLGQSEIDIDNAVDMLLMLVPPGGGDGLQATKKGIMEAADLVIINKADGTLLTQAKHTCSDYKGAMHFIKQKNIHWQPSVELISAREQTGLNSVESRIAEFHDVMSSSGSLSNKRIEQAMHWMWAQYRRQIVIENEKREDVKMMASKLKADLTLQRISSRLAAQKLVELG